MMKIISVVRNYIKKLSKVFFRNELTRKKAIVKIYNLKQVLKKKNKKSDLFDYNNIITNSKFYSNEYYKGNSLYGISNVLRDYCGYDNEVCGCIEHGVYFGKYIDEKEAIKSGLPAVLTYSDVRESTLREKQSSKLIFKIGPYIKYAKTVISDDEIKKLKKKNGKTLLVFPTHSIDRVETKFDYEGFINEILKFKEKHNFKTVLISMYYRDIELGKNKIYEKYGFKVVCNGLKEDVDFLARQKTFIKLSDYTISNSVGTHIGYSVCLGVPHTIIKQKMIYKSDSKFDEENVPNLYLESSVIQKQEVEDCFLKYNNKINDKQLSICKKYWGINYVYSKEEMNELFSFLRELSADSKFKENKYNSVFEENFANYCKKYPKIKEQLINNVNR